MTINSRILTIYLICLLIAAASAEGLREKWKDRQLRMVRPIPELYAP